MRTIHKVHFPNYATIVLEKRTLFHMPVDGKPWAIGDGLRLLGEPNFPPGKVGVLTDVRQVRLLDELDVDLPKLGGIDRAQYLASWTGLHPGLSVDLLVWRIEFRYGGWESDPTDPPEWSLAA